VNSPEVAILGSGRAYWEAGVHDTVKRLRLPLSLSYDHRIIDGADGARFLKWIVEAVEEPMLLSLEG
jgi:pyruvate dehydrogenase E2 component (dihydrolipoamide acetyltransferase)